MENQASFEGWAVLELMGHNREIGFVRTEYFGGHALFRVDQPEIPAREYVLTRPEWADDALAGIGSRLQRCAIPGKTTYVGPSSIFRITPCTEETALQAIERLIRAPVKILDLAEQAKIGAAADETDGAPQDDDKDMPF